MKTVYGYIRVSSVRQGEGVSLLEQRSAIERYAVQNKLFISQWFEEKETAAKRGRPLFTRMLDLLKSGNADGVVIHKIDRSARNLKDWADLGEMIDHGIDVYFAHESLDLHARGGRLSADIQAVIAADYIRNLREETKKGFYGRLKQGLYPLPSPIGYLDKGKPKEIDHQVAPLIRKTFELYATGTFNLINLGKEMYRLGLRNKKGNRVSKTGLSIMLNNTFYTGIITLRKTNETFNGIHEPLISPVIFKKVRRVLKGKVKVQSGRYSFVLSKLLKCSYCSYSLIGEKQKGKVYYRCHTRNCITKTIREEKVENKIVYTLKCILIEEPEIEEKIRKMRKSCETERDFHIKTMSLNAKKAEDRLHNLTDGYIDGVIDELVFKSRQRALIDDLKTCESEISELSSSMSVVPDNMSDFLEHTKNVQLSYELGNIEEKQDILKTVTSNRFVEGKNVLVELCPPYNDISKCLKLQYGGPYRARPRTFEKKETLADRLFNIIYRYCTRKYRGDTEGKYDIQAS